MTTKETLKKRVQDAGLRSLRVVFPDQHGVLRGKTILPTALDSVLEGGMRVPSTLLLKDTSHRTVFPVWENSGAPEGLQGVGDILLTVEPEALYPLPWADGSAWLWARPSQLDGTPLLFAPQTVLDTACARLGEAGYALTIGLEVEFHIFALEDPALAHAQATMPGQPPRTRNIAQGYQFLTDQRYDRMEPVLEEIRIVCDGLGLPLRTMELEMGPSQVEMTFAPDTPKAHARNMILLRAAVKAACARKGLHASFMCRPVVENAAASGWHVHMSLSDKARSRNLMMPRNDGALTSQASGWIAGLLAQAKACCALTTPTVNGYRRFQPYQLAPDRIQWGRDNRGAMVRAIMAPGDAASRIENRVPEPAANPYYVLAAQIHAGLSGIEAGLRAPDPVERPYDSGAPGLPRDLGAALDAFEGSDFIRDRFGPVFQDYFAQIKRAEWRRYLDTLSHWEACEYFDLF